MRSGRAFLVVPLLGAAALNDACPDQILNGTGVGGADATAILNVSDAGECCAMCHGDYHDECVAWEFGATAASKLYPEHNCAIMASVLKKRQVAGHVSGIVAAPTPTPTPTPPSPSPVHGGPPCRADLDCAIADSKLWRCNEVANVTPTPENNCHWGGPGNTTCECISRGCGSGAAAPKNASAVQYLMIGDSISLGMKNRVRSLVNASGWELEHNPGNANNANWGAHGLAGWLRTAPPASRHWDVISFNFGLHDIAYRQERLTLEQYRALLSNITATLVAEQERSGTKLLWVTTTPVPSGCAYDPNGNCSDYKKCLNPPRFDADVVLYNTAAAEIMRSFVAKGAAISTLDLYSYVLKKCGGPGYKTCGKYQLPHNVHFYSAGWADMAQHMTNSLLALFEPTELTV